MSLFRPQRLNLSSRGLAKVLGDVEAQLLELLWKRGPLSVRDLVEGLQSAKRSLSFNATMTILNRLVAKGILRKSKIRDGGRQVFLYEPVSKRNDFLQRTCRDVFDKVFRDDRLFSPAGFLAAVDGLPKKERDEILRLLRTRS